MQQEILTVGNVVGTTVGIGAAAVVVEYLVNFIKKPLPEAWKSQEFIPWLIAAIVGVLVAVMFKIDILQQLGLASISDIAAYVISGLILAGGSTVVHEFIGNQKAKRWINEEEAAKLANK